MSTNALRPGRAAGTSATRRRPSRKALNLSIGHPDPSLLTGWIVLRRMVAVAVFARAGRPYRSAAPGSVEFVRDVTHGQTWLPPPLPTSDLADERMRDVPAQSGSARYRSGCATQKGRGAHGSSGSAAPRRRTHRPPAMRPGAVAPRRRAAARDPAP